MSCHRRLEKKVQENMIRIPALLSEWCLLLCFCRYLLSRDRCCVECWWSSERSSETYQAFNSSRTGKWKWWLNDARFINSFQASTNKILSPSMDEVVVSRIIPGSVHCHDGIWPSNWEELYIILPISCYVVVSLFFQIQVI